MSMIIRNHHSTGFFLQNYLTKNPQEIFKMCYWVAGQQMYSYLDLFNSSIHFILLQKMNPQI